MSQLQQEQEQGRALKMLDVIAENWGISLHDLEPSIRQIYSIPDITLEHMNGSWFAIPIAILQDWQKEGILHATSWDSRYDRKTLEINLDNWIYREGIRLELTNRGMGFYENREVPPSKYTKKKVKRPKESSNSSIADRIIQKRRNIREPENTERAKEKIAQAIAARQGQEKFRQELLQMYGPVCLVTGPNILDTLEAAHIKPYSEGGTFDRSNGLLLRADIHTLFDLGLIAINTADMTVIISSKLNQSPYQALSGQKLHFPTGRESIPSKDGLDTHRALANL